MRSMVPSPDFVRAKAPETTPDKVAVLVDATWIVESELIAIAPDIVAVLVKFTAPADDAPPPLIVSGSAEVKPVLTNVAPDATVVPALDAPSAAALDMVREP